MDKILQLARQRNRVLVFAALSFLLWQGATLGLDIADAMRWAAPTGIFTLQLSLIVGAVAWAVAMLFLLIYQRNVKQAGACLVLRDELFLRNRALAFMYGYAGMLIAAVLLLAVVTFIEFNAAIAIRTVLIAGVFVPLVMMAVLGREPVGED